MFSNAYKAYLIALSLASLSFASPVPDSPDAGHSITPSSNATDIVSGGSSSSDVAPVAADLITNSTLVAPEAADVAPAADTGPTSDLNITNSAAKWAPVHTRDWYIDAKGNALKKHLGPATSGYINDGPPFNTIHKNYKYGAVYSHDTAHGASAIYGAIYKKFLTNQHFGYPITDELTAPTWNGVSIRYNAFSNNNAIFWTGKHGAHFVYGGIYAHWLKIGGTRSVIGYPIDDEHSTGTHGGRTQTFSNGYIYWHAGSIWVHVGPIPNSLSFSWPNISLRAVSGWSTITLNSNGKVRWQSFLHDSVPWKFDWSISWVLVDADKTAISLAQHGTVGPNLGWFGKHDSNVDKTIDNAESAEIRNNWRAWVASTQWKSRADTTWAWKALIHDLWVTFKEAGPVIALLA